MSKESRFNTNELLNIIHKYYNDGNYIGKKLSFSELARYAKVTLGYNDIQYYHFSRNSEINDMVNKYNKELDSSSILYSGKDNSFVNLNVKEFVKIYCGDKEKLTFCLTNLQESQRKLFDRKVELEIKNKQLEDSNELLKKQRDEARCKNKEYKNKIDTMKNIIKKLRAALDIEEEKQLISAVNSTGLYTVESKGEAKIQEDIEKLDDDNGKDLKKLLDKFPAIFSNS